MQAGLVEAFAPPEHGGAWLFIGWTARPWASEESADRLILHLQAGSVTGPATTYFYPRSDVPTGAVGFVAVIHAPRPPVGDLIALELSELNWTLPVVGQALAQAALTLGARARQLVHAGPDSRRHAILALLPRRGYDGTDSVGQLWPPVHLEFDQALWVPPDGVALVGWFVDAGRSVAALRVRGTGAAVEIEPATWVQIKRPDVVEALASRYSLEQDTLGFIAYAPGVAAPGTELYIEIETRQGEIAYKPVRPVELFGLGIIKQLLAVPRQPRARLEAAFENVLGPVIEGLNHARLAQSVAVAALAFGPPPVAPDCSVVVPLYGRVDFMEYQLALFAERPDPNCELIYVLDDPRHQDEVERLAESCWARFRLPFRLLMPEMNLGFAPATNLGIDTARGAYVCLLNSDVFPIGSAGLTWIAKLIQCLKADVRIGTVGPLLLYEDDTVQHAGMHYERVVGLPSWTFPIHTGKGEPAPAAAGLREVQAITGACMMLRRTDLVAVGGLDQGYLIGDFEDSDLCLKLRARGQRCVVDTDIRLYHLERQSQGTASAWRLNATLVNAWRHQKRWQASGLLPDVSADQ